MKRPTPSFAVSVLALVVASSGASYAAATIGSADIRNDSILSRDIDNNTVRSIDVRNGSLRMEDFADGELPSGARGPRGSQGEQGPAGVGRWLLINAAGEIEAQSGGFTVAAAYPTLANTQTPPADDSLRANGNVYINANEPLDDNAVVATIALQNQTDQNADGIRNGRAPGADANPEFSGEISASVCGLTGFVACAPTGTNNINHFVVSPRNSDGSVTADGTRKRFYVVISGDSSDFVAPVG